MSAAAPLPRWFAALVGALPPVAMRPDVAARQRGELVERCEAMNARVLLGGVGPATGPGPKDAGLYGGDVSSSLTPARAALMADLKRIDREISRLEREAGGYWDGRVWDAYTRTTDEMARLDAQRRDVRRRLKEPRR